MLLNHCSTFYFLYTFCLVFPLKETLFFYLRVSLSNNEKPGVFKNVKNELKNIFVYSLSSINVLCNDRSPCPGMRARDGPAYPLIVSYPSSRGCWTEHWRLHENSPSNMVSRPTPADSTRFYTVHYKSPLSPVDVGKCILFYFTVVSLIFSGCLVLP